MNDDTTRILVTGGAGFIGSAYVRALLRGPRAENVTITVLDRLTYAGNPANLAAVRDHPGFAFVHGDVCDAGLVDELAATHDEMVHFAAESHVDRSIEDAADSTRTNVLGTQTLLAAAVRRGVGRFVHVSTDEVYGSVAEGSWPESSPVRPNSPYAASKAAGDLMALAYHRTHGLDVRVTRGSNTYGPYQYPEKIIPRFVTDLLQGRPVPLYGDGRNVRDWLHVDDHVLGVELVRRHGRPGEVYNIGGGNELTNRELTGLLLAACGTGWEMVREVADRKGHDLRYSVDCSKIRDELGYRPRHDFHAGLAATVAWYRDNRDWWEPSVWRP
ncbi:MULTISPECIES: dTDP-glucose 4,6-dehydratase [Streptomycetaceae]|uniref:dTDP-glucose 4,6-dehydratase n=1 Tax=Streptantibioticus cattleyicolor (strain ATCC 35852 / DSM 46488 / JCM 4925 / NBRC 14057 / NRRL 8057) TaxID=1003195 RepID=F8K053_STREN|nr:MULTISPECIES: dTDP-glucose 4,6-dehydratase [Streptomycetaceae]AEW94834.1 dTDP-glucose 4,6-dehydratase [Streptantibioticus cattleyicolor NRRL 8057 = DSM 46488]MYS59454.1 dTDP-glucose 4,6-dehydratase [Streptomyces sp. SID5468]CCB75189.1 dTDP-glucose 4,6-dehydratase [Streptantibioticus cattleyicolor NRRL 8057 = DSM 46488]